jgi:conjugative relaxase-like TrwC/TraI family protein
VHWRWWEWVVTARVTTLKSAEAGLYYVEHLPSYYLAEGEPPGVWHGRGAEALGLAGEVRDGEFLAVMAGVDPRSGEQLGRRYGEASVRGFDVTASAPKSVSVLFAVGSPVIREAVLDAHDRAVAAMVGWVERHAHTRFRIAGQVAVVDAEGIVAAGFRQHTSRALDPQLHTHVVIANRVLSPDGRWLALDARTLKVDQRTLSALYHATLRSGLTASLGVRWQEPVNGIAEIADVPEMVLAGFSSRTQDVRRRLVEKLDRFEADLGRLPTTRERWQLEREAVVDSRPAKPTAGDAARLHARWTAELGGLGYEPVGLVDAATGRVVSAGLDQSTAARMVDRGIEALSERQSTWRPAELVRELAAAVPTDAGVDPDQLTSWLDDLADEVIAQRMVDISRPVPAGVLLRRDGRPVSESAIDRALTTADILAQETLIADWAQERADAGGIDNPDVIEWSVVELSPSQADVAAAVAGTRDLVLVVGPAGTGKTTALAPAIAELHAQGRPVFGVAPSAAAAEVLAVETGVDADTLDKLLIEHTLGRQPQRRYDLPSGALVIVDEAGMVSTPKLAELAVLADWKGWRIALVGDPLQFSAVGRSGMFAHLVDHHDHVICLDGVHRFHHTWERDASLRLRRGDDTVLDLYDRNGRIHGGIGTAPQRAVTRAWLHAREHGETVALMAPTTDTVIELNHLAQQRLVDAGRLDPTGPTVNAGPYRLHVGDEIVTRHNDRHLLTDRGLMVKNRDHWTIADIASSGDLAATGPTGTVGLPASYVAEHVELGYAQTSHANQGRTVDRALLYLDSPTDVRGIYVPLTRGRLSNDVYVTLHDNRTAIEVVAESLRQDWIDTPAIDRRTQLQQPDRSVGLERRLQPLSADRLRDLLVRNDQLTGWIDRHDATANQLRFDISRLTSERDKAERHLDDTRQRLASAERTLERYDKPLRRRRHYHQISPARHDATTAHQSIRYLTKQIADHDRQLAGLQADLRQINEQYDLRVQRGAELDAISSQLDDDLRLRIVAAAHQPDPYIIDIIGPRPPDPAIAQLWDSTAAHLDRHLTAFYGELPDPADDLTQGAFTSSQDTVAAAIHQLVDALNPAQIEPPSRSLDLGLSL